MAQAPFDKMASGFEVVYTVKADIPDPEQPERVSRIYFQVTQQTKGGITVVQSKNLNQPGVNERTIVESKDVCLYNVDSLDLPKKGFYTRFVQERGPGNMEFYEPTYVLNGHNTASLLSKYPATAGTSKFEIAGDAYELTLDKATNLVSKAKIRFATGPVFEKNAIGFKRFGNIILPSKVVSVANFNPVVETKTYELISAKRVDTISVPFTKTSLPKGSMVSDKIDYIQYEVGDDGKWQKVGSIPKPDRGQRNPSGRTGSVVMVCVALSLIGSSLFIRNGSRTII